MALQPDSKAEIDRATTAPFLLRLFWRMSRPLDAWEFSVAPPADTTGIADYSALLPPSIRQQSVQIYTWPDCTIGELTTLFTSVIPASAMPSPAVGTRLVFKLIFPDTRATMGEGGRGKWIDKPLGSVVIGGKNGDLDNVDMDADDVDIADNLEGDALKALADARFVIGDYVACSIYPPGPDGRIAPVPYQSSRGPPRDPYGGPPRGPGGLRDNGPGRQYGQSGGGYRRGPSGRPGGFGAPPPPGDWRRGERPPDGYESFGGRGGGGHRGYGGRPY